MSSALKVTILGCGRVGTSLASMIVQSEGLELSALYGRKKTAVKAAGLKTGAEKVCSDFKDLPSSDIYLVAIDDDALESFSKNILDAGLAKGKVIAHLSGSESSQVFSKLQADGTFVASCHPLKSFTEKLISLEEFDGTSCVLEGDSEACEALEKLFSKLGAKTFRINSENKLKYHSAAVFASNYLVTLLDIAGELLNGIGLDKSFRGLEQLSQQVLQNVFSQGTEKALTGPIERGELEVVRKELDCLSDHRDIALLYAQLAKRTSEIAVRKGSISAEKKSELECILKTIHSKD